MSGYVKTVSTNFDVDLFSIGPVGGTLLDYIGSVKSLKIKEEVGEVRVDGACTPYEDVEPGKRKWSADLTHNAVAALVGQLRAGDIIAIKCKSGIEANSVSPYVREGIAMVASREDAVVNGDTDPQTVAITLRGKGELSDVVTP